LPPCPCCRRMRSMPVAPEIETKTLYFEFEQAGSRLVQPLDLAELFNGLNSILRELAYIAHEEGDWRGFADVDVLQLAMRSPLKILLRVARLPKNAVRAFVTLCERVLFVEEERYRRAALAASAWEDAT
jgi:hypothetical protein